MTDTPSDADVADRLTRRRARVFPVLAIFFVIQQSAYWSNPPHERLVDHVRIGAWAAMAIAILLVVATGGAWFRKPAVRAMVNDEQARANRDAAMRAAFIVSTVVGIALYILQAALALTAGEAIHLIVSAGLVTLLMRFGMLERRGLG